MLPPLSSENERRGLGVSVSRTDRSDWDRAGIFPEHPPRNRIVTVETTNGSLNRKLRMALVGGGQGAFIGRVHATAAVMDNRAALVAGALSSDAARAKASAPSYDIAPDRIAALAKRVEKSGRSFVDAPVSGGVTGARNGTLTIMAAAKKSVFDNAQPVLAAMGSSLHYLGEQPGQGAAMKVVNQLLCGVHIVAAAEGLAFAERAGIDPQKALEVLSGSAAQSWMLNARGPRMIDYDTVVTSAVDIFVKDLALVLDSGRAAKMGLPLAAAAHQLFLAASAMGHGTEDDSQVIETYRALLGKK